MPRVHNPLILISLLLFLIGFVSCQEQEKKTFERQNFIPTAKDDQSLETAALEQKLDSLFTMELDSATYLGAGVSVIIGDQVVYEKGFGYRDAIQRKKVDVNSVFRVGSLSKAFTGALVGILSQKENLNLNLPVHSILPGFKLQADSLTRRVRLKHLLSHSAGFPYHSYTNLVEANLSMPQIIPYFAEINNMKPSGEVYSYQNAAFATSGEVISSVLGRDIKEIFQVEMFDPLEMCHTSLDYESIRSDPNVALPHSKTKNGWRQRRLNKKYYNAIPAGGINTSTKDVSKLLLALLGEQPDILSQNSIEVITRPLIPTNVKYRYYKKWPNFLDSSYGTGWRIHRFQECEGGPIDTLYHHGGMVNNYRSEIAFKQRERIAICVMFNSYSSLSKNIVPRILDIINHTQSLEAGRNTNSNIL